MDSTDPPDDSTDPTLPFNVPPPTQRFSGFNPHRHPFMSQRVNPHFQRNPLARTNFTGPSTATISVKDERCNSLPFVNGSGDYQTEHPSPNPGKSLADIANRDCFYPNNTPDSATKQREHIDQTPYDVAGRENALKLEHKYNTWVNVENATFTPHAFIDQDPGDSLTEAFQHHEIFRSYLQVANSQNKLETNCHSQTCLDGEVARSLSLTRQQAPFNMIQPVPCPRRNWHPAPTVSISQPSSSALHQLKTNRHSQIHSDGEGARSLSSARKQTPFNTIQPISYPEQYWNPTPIMSMTKPSSSGLQLNNLLNFGAYPEQYWDPTPIMSMTKPSSSGLQLNNILNFGATVNMKSALMGSSSVQERKSKPSFNSMDEPLLRGSTVDNKLEERSNHERLLSAHRMKSSDKSAVLNPIQDQSTQADKNKHNAENVGDEEEFYRKQMSEPGLDANCMVSCKCKKSKCVKLYCECFAAGFYCSKACSCQGCFNSKQCDDEVHEAREIIEARNPLAFRTKVVQNSIEPSAIGYGEDGSRVSPSSARHVKGCSCKKSMCLKNYCDCYRSKVGCSDGCHCEGCQNVYGRLKGEKGIRKGPLSGEENNQKTDSSLFDSCNTPAPTNDGHNNFLGTDQNSTPLSPSFLHSNQEEEGSKCFWWYVKKYVEPVPSYPHLDNNESVPKTAKETLDPLWSYQEPDLGNAETKEGFEFPIQYHEPEETGTSSGAHNYIEWTNYSAPRFPSGSSHYSRASSQIWHGSPSSPLLEDPPMSLNPVKVSSQNKKRVCSLRDPVQEFGSSSPVGLPKSTPASTGQQTKDPQD